MYIAKRYVGIRGKIYSAGEVIQDLLTEDQIAWLVKSGAVEQAAPAVKAEDPAVPEVPEVPKAPEEAPPKAVKKPAAKKTAERRKGK